MPLLTTVVIEPYMYPFLAFLVLLNDTLVEVLIFYPILDKSLEICHLSIGRNDIGGIPDKVDTVLHATDFFVQI